MIKNFPFMLVKGEFSPNTALAPLWKRGREIFGPTVQQLFNEFQRHHDSWFSLKSSIRVSTG